MKFQVHAGTDSVRARVLTQGTRTALEVEEVPQEVHLPEVAGWDPKVGGIRRVRSAGGWRSFSARLLDDGAWEVVVQGERHVVTVLDPGQEAIREARRASGGHGGPAPLRAPMPGLVIRVEVEVGQLVEPGDGLLIVEAMKMENELRATAGARIRAVHVEAGIPVEKDALLVEFEPLPDEADSP